MLILGKDNILYSWIWKEDTKVKKYRRLDINGVAMLSLRGSEAFLIKRVAIPQLTQVISYPQNAYSNVPFSVILTLHDQFGPGYIPDALISFGFTKEKANEVNEIEYDFRMSDDDETTIIIVTPFSFGDYWMHIYVEKQEIYSSPLKVSIAPSPTEEVLLIKTDELKQLEKMVSIKRTERALKREQEKKKAVEDRAVKMERTRKRAQEALKNYLETKESEIIANAKMLQRKATTKKTGGGYIISD